MNSITETLTNHFKNAANLEIDDKSIYENTFNDTQPYFKKLCDRKKNKQPQKNNLILWDIENISFKGSISEFSSICKNNETIKVISIKKDGYFSCSEEKNNVYFVKQQLINKKWHIHHEKKDADNGLYYFWNKYKNSIKQLILISNDKDFENILIEAKEMGIDYKILYSHYKTNWLLKYNNIFIDEDNHWLSNFNKEN